MWPLDVVVLDDAILTNADEEIVAIVDNVAERFTNVGCHVRREVSPVPFVELIGQHRIVEEYEIARMHQSLMNESGDSIGEKLREAILRGHQISDDIYRQARRFLINSQDRFWGRFQKVDALLFPAMPQTAPRGIQATGDPSFIIPWTSLGGPIVTLPAGFAKNGLPVAVLLSGLPGTDLVFGRLACRFAEVVAGPG